MEEIKHALHPLARELILHQQKGVQILHRALHHPFLFGGIPWKGKKMAGRMGSDRVTVKNLKVVSVDKEKNELHVSGPIPGTNGKLVIIKKTS